MNVTVNLFNKSVMGRFANHNMLKSTQDKLQRQADRDNKIAFFEAQKANLKEMKTSDIEDIARKLEMFHTYNDEIAAAKQEYNSSQMFHTMDEAREKGEKIAEEAKKNKPKTEEEKKQEVQEKLTEEAGDGEADSGLLSEVMDKIDEVIDNTQEENEVSDMGVQITGVQNSTGVTESSKAQAKPTWDGNKVYKYIEDFNDAAISYGNRAANYYCTQTMADGEMSVDDLKKQIGEMFSGYTMTDREPTDVVNGKHYLYIDNSQLKKMASDPEYRAKVYGLMDREYTCSQTYTLQYSDGRNVTEHCTGSFFSLSEKNGRYAGADGIPYLGGCATDHPWSSSDSHSQVRNQSFLYDNVDPAKSAAKNRKTAAASNNSKKTLKKLQEKKQEAKRLEKKRADKRAEKEEFEQRLEDIRAARDERNSDIEEVKGWQIDYRA